MLRLSSCLFVAAVVATALLSSSSSLVSAVELRLFNRSTENGHLRCMASQVFPAEPRPLEFCYWQNARSCCTPANDAAAKDAFQTFTALGAGCAPTDHRMRRAYREVRQFACLGCDPREPEYREWKADENTYKWKVCLSFFFGKDGKSGLWRGDGKRFDECGVKGPDFLVPSVAFGNITDKMEVAAQFGAILPTFLSGFAIEIVNDTIEADGPFNCFASAGYVSITASLATALLLLFIM